jgi:hypothetical protein
MPLARALFWKNRMACFFSPLKAVLSRWVLTVLVGGAFPARGGKYTPSITEFQGPKIRSGGFSHYNRVVQKPQFLNKSNITARKSKK